jgi:hypothetical protein
MNEGRIEGKRPWPDLSYHTGICLEGLMKTTETYIGDLNQVPFDGSLELSCSNRTFWRNVTALTSIVEVLGSNADRDTSFSETLSGFPTPSGQIPGYCLEKIRTASDHFQIIVHISSV